MKVSDVVDVLERVASPAWAASWDNVGLLAGDPASRVRKLLTCVDATESVLDEALAAKAQMIVAHHPVIFKGITRVTPSSAPVVYRAVRRGIAIYCMHTNFDAAPHGTNDFLADALGLKDPRPIEAMVESSNVKVVVFVMPTDLSAVASAAFAAGAGRIDNYCDCAFFSHGIGAFCGGEGSDPTCGQAGRHETAEEMRLEVIAPRSRAADVCSAIRAVHSYETPAIDVYPLEGYLSDTGNGRVGTLGKGISVAGMIRRIKKATGLKNVQIARGQGPSTTLTTAACGAGSCGSLYQAALAAGAELYLTGEMKHSDLLAAVAAGLTVVCLGHGNSERAAMDALALHLGDVFEGLDASPAGSDRDPLEIA